jgi:hypothetical protein
MIWIISYFVICGILALILPKKTFLYRYCINALVGLDNLVNACVFLGDPDETISSAAYKGRLKGHKGWTLLDKFLDIIDPGHGAKVVEWDEGKDAIRKRKK